MRVIITGGTGLIGKALANSLARDHHEVIVLTRNTNKTSGFENSVRVVGWDAKTSSGWGELVDGAGAIVNLAGESINGDGFLPSRWTAERKRRITDSRVNAGQAVAEAVQKVKNKPGVVIQASAVGYYGPTGDEEITEESPMGSDFLAEVCKVWEASTAEVEQMGVRRAIIRTGLPLSMEGGVLTRLHLLTFLGGGGPIAGGRHYFPWIHIKDEIRAIRFLIDTPEASGPFNLSAPNPVTQREFARVLGKVMRRPSFVPTPGFAFTLAFGEVGKLLTQGQRQIPKRLLELGFEFEFPELEAALRDLLHKQRDHAPEPAHAH